MHTEKIGLQEFAVRVLKSHIKASRVSHTYLLTGEENSGKEEVAMAFAAALNCLQKNYFQDCECLSCGKIDRKSHPDVHVLGEDADARSIKIEEIRTAIGEAALKPYEGKWKVFILKDAERLTNDASNALLKTLEEAPEHTVFILVTGTKANMLETIQSRSFEIRLRPLAGQEMPIPASYAPEKSGKPWEDILEESGSTRVKLQESLDLLITYFGNRLKEVGARSPHPGRGDLAPTAILETLDLLTESKEALDANANQKLVVSRLAMQLRRTLTSRNIS